MECLIFLLVVIGFIVILAIANSSTESSTSSRRPASSRTSTSRTSTSSSSRTARKEGIAEDQIGGAYRIKELEDDSDDPSSTLRQSRQTWVQPGHSVTVQGRTLKDGMVYTGSTLAALSGYGTDPALVNPDLNAWAETPDQRGQNLRYFPSYSELPPASRSAYLNWLEQGRRDPEYAIGYVFLFFYGLERRIIFDAAKDESVRPEVEGLIDELEALLEVYGTSSGSFRGYCDRLIGYARRVYGYEVDLEAPSYTSDDRSFRLSSAEKRTLGQFFETGSPLPAEWALAWMHGSAAHRLRTPGNRCRTQFDALFRRRYNERFGEGIVVEAEPTSSKVKYRPASGGMRFSVTATVDGAVDASSVDLPKEIQRLATTVEDELEPYSRWIGRRDDRTSVAALGLLPAELIRDEADDEARAFVEKVETWLEDEGRAVVPSQDLVDLWPSKNDDYLTKTEAEALSGFLAGFEIGVEPDVRYTRDPSKRDYLTLFTLPEPDRPPSETCQSARLLLHLAAAVATADERIDQEEEEHIEVHLERALDLTLNEQARLRAHLARLLHNPPTLRGVRRRAEELSDDDRRSLATFLLTVAGADGHLEGDEITVLEKIYDILGLDESQVHQDLHSLRSRSPGQSDRGPVKVIDADTSTEYRIPDEEDETGPSGENADAQSGIELDLDRVAAIQDETKDVARVLGDVFDDDESEEPPGFEAEGLTDAHEAFLVELVERETWPRDDFDALAESHGLMPGFAYEQINDVAFEEAGEPLLEGDDPIDINPFALDALQS